ncbi:methyltransferase domain-containing protein [Haloechinothrix halophila]|uniref:methyltransferase domain-containing protein n=1 Tax=Haloechinothrix halophila TaxID=1069073 RepID=UPI00040E0520|nr:methyltransferase domain-containing protein [Haloechinothrix halophila]
MTEWRDYVGEFHDHRPAITERLLTRTDHSPYEWLAEPLRGIDEPMLDLACGSAPTRDHLPTAHWVGLDFSAAELAAAREAGRGPLVRASADALPLRDRSLNAVCAAMCLPVVTPLDDVLGELNRVMRPGATLAALVPAGLGLSPAGWLGWLTVMRALGIRGQPWPNPEARDGLARLLRTHGFDIVSDDRRVFRLDLTAPDSTDLLVDSLYVPDLDPHRVDDAKRILRRRTTSRQRLPLPLRRVVASMPAP